MMSSIVSNRESEVLNGVLEVLKDEFHPPRIILFGSRAKGTNSPQSDFDLAVDVKKPADFSLTDFEDKIDDLRGLYQVDLVFLPDVEPEFREVVLDTGKVIYAQRH